MIGLKTSKGWIDFFPETSVTITEVNPLFDDKSGGRSFSYSFDIPTSGRNIKIFSAAHRLDVRVGDYIDDVTMYIDGLPYERGRIKVTAKKNKSISIRFEDLNRKITEEIEKLKLPEAVGDILMPTIQQPGFTLTIEDANLPINNYAVLKVKINDQEWTAIRSWIQFPGYDQRAEEAKSLANFINGIDAGAATVNGYVVTVTPTMRTILAIKNIEGPITMSNYSAFGPAIEFNMKAYFMQETTDVAWPLISNPDFYKKKDNPAWEGLVNFWEDGATHSEPLFPEGDDDNPVTWRTCYVPMFYVKFVLEKIAKKLQLAGVAGSFFEIEDASKIIIYNDFALDHVFFEYSTNNDILGHSFGSQLIAAANHLPDTSVKDFLDKFTKFFALTYEFKNQKLLINQKKHQLLSAPIDWTKKTEPIYRQPTKTPKKGILAYKDLKKEKAKDPNQLNNFIFGNGEEKIDTGVAPLIDKYEKQLTFTDGGTQVGFKKTRIIPASHMPGASAAKNSSKKPDDLRLLIYRGIQTDINGKTYRQASNITENPNGDKIGDLTLEFFDENYPEESIVKKLWKEVLRLIDAPEIELINIINIGDILAVKKWGNTIRTIQFQEGKMTGVIKSIQFKAHIHRPVTKARVKYIRYDYIN